MGSKLMAWKINREEGRCVGCVCVCQTTACEFMKHKNKKLLEEFWENWGDLITKEIHRKGQTRSNKENRQWEQKQSARTARPTTNFGGRKSRRRSRRRRRRTRRRRRRRRRKRRRYFVKVNKFSLNVIKIGVCEIRKARRFKEKGNRRIKGSKGKNKWKRIKVNALNMASCLTRELPTLAMAWKIWSNSRRGSRGERQTHTHTQKDKLVNE